MKLQTHILMQKTWRYLQNNLHLNGFDSELQFIEAFKELGEVADAGTASYISRRSTSEPFTSYNVQLTNVETEHDFEKVTSPAIRGGVE